MGNGKEWRIVVNEKYGSVEATIFDSKKVFGELNRPFKAVCLFVCWLREQPTFPFESLVPEVLSGVLNRPLVFKDDKKES